MERSSFTIHYNNLQPTLTLESLMIDDRWNLAFNPVPRKKNTAPNKFLQTFSNQLTKRTIENFRENRDRANSPFRDFSRNPVENTGLNMFQKGFEFFMWVLNFFFWASKYFMWQAQITSEEIQLVFLFSPHAPFPCFSVKRRQFHSWKNKTEGFICLWN